MKPEAVGGTGDLRQIRTRGRPGFPQAGNQDTWAHMKFFSTADQSAVKALEGIGGEWLAKTCALFPEHASRLGFKKFEPLLGENTPDIHRKHGELLADTLRKVEDLPEGAFSGDDWLDRRGFLSRLRTDLVFSRDLKRWRTNPHQHADSAVDAVFDLVVRASGNLSRALPSIESRLGKIPDFLAAGAECVRLPVPLWTSLTVKSSGGSVEFLHGLEPELAAVSPHPARTKSLLRSAVTAFEDFAKAVERKKQGPPGAFAVGRERFEFLMRERLGLDLTLREAKAVGERLVARQDHLLQKAAEKIGRRPAQEVIEEAAAHWTPPGSLLEHYRRTTRDIKRQLASADLVTLPKGESLKVLPVPPFLRHQFPTAAYNPPQPFSRSMTGIFWVNDLSLDEMDPEKKLAEIRQHFGLELTAVHEAYPGHHLQFVVQFQHPSRIRRLCEHSIFYEGWTMWCEQMAVDHGLVAIPHAKLIQLHDALWRAHRIIIDCGLQEGSLTPAAAARRLEKGVGFTPARARGDVNWYTSSPTVPMSYLLGRIEVEKLHRRLVRGGGWTLKQFNDWMLSHGSLPWSWIWQASRSSIFADEPPNFTETH